LFSVIFKQIFNIYFSHISFNIIILSYWSCYTCAKTF